MRGIFRLIDGLVSGDPEALYILIFAVVATVVIYIAVEYIRKARNQ